MTRILFAAILAALPLPSAAQEVIAEYSTLIGPRDFFNSSGGRLTDPCAILQQDRANDHRFARADEMDDFDPIFASREARAVLGRSCRVAGWRRDDAFVPGELRAGRTRFVRVVVFGRGRQPSYAIYGEGAG